MARAGETAEHDLRHLRASVEATRAALEEARAETAERVQAAVADATSKVVVCDG